jgi:uncharacterized protein (TIGR00297 family)
MIESIRYRKLTKAGALAGGLIGFLVFAGAGFTGLGMLALFFLAGTAATSWKRRQKSESGMAQEKNGRRLGQVLANGGAGGLLGLLSLLFPEQKPLFALLMAGAFSSAIADTLSSELGTVYGKSFYNITTFHPDKKGLDGVVSLEGTCIGIAGSVLIATVYCFGYGWTNQFFWIVLAGTIGNLSDSVLGATVERRQILGNDAVNFLNTAIGAAVMLLAA